MPAAAEPPAAKKERDELLLQALKEHIMRERQKKKQEQEAEVEEERLRKEREERDRQDAMTLEDTKEQIQLLQTRLEELKNEKQQLFLSLKKVLNEDGSRKKQQQQKDSEILAMQSIANTPQIFLPPRQQQLMPKYLQGAPPPMSGMNSQQIKRTRSPSPTPPGFYKSPNPPYSQSSKLDDGRRSVLWNKPTYQNPPGTLYYPSNPQDGRGQPIIYPSYAPNLNLSIHPNYHMELSQVPQQQAPPNQQTSSQGPNQSFDMNKAKAMQQSGQVYHINLDAPPQSSSQQQSSAQKLQVQQSGQHKVHPQQITLEKMNERVYHMEKGPPPPPNHMNEAMYRMPIGIVSLPQSLAMQNIKGGGSISQGYPNRAPPGPQQPPPSSQNNQPPIHYQRQRY